MKTYCCGIQYFCLEEQSSFQLVLVFDRRVGLRWQVMYEGHPTIIQGQTRWIVSWLQTFLCILLSLDQSLANPYCNFCMYFVSAIQFTYIIQCADKFIFICILWHVSDCLLYAQTCFLRTSTHIPCRRDRVTWPCLALLSYYVCHR